jgi:hypothetical protein
MGLILIGIILLVLKWVLAFPASIELLLLLAGLILIIWGAVILISSGGIRSNSGSRRWW